LKILSEFLLFCYYLPHGDGVVLRLYNSNSHLPKDNLCQLWLKLANRQTNRQTIDNGRPEKLRAFSSDELNRRF
jgi:hypothetical protein